MYIMAAGVLLGALDRIGNNRLGYGAKFEEGFQCMGFIALSMVGMICMIPIISAILKPLIIPFYQFLGADPGMFGSILAIDMGGYSLAVELAQNEQIGLFSGIIVASMLGVTLIFTIPLGLEVIAKEDYEYFAKGILIGILPIPLGSMVGGLLMGLPFLTVLINTIPTLLLVLVLGAGLKFFPKGILKGFMIFSKGIRILTTIGLGGAAITYMTGITVIPGILDIMEPMKTVAGISIVLLGSLPIAYLFSNVMQKPLKKLGNHLGLDEVSIVGMIFSCISILPTLITMKDMTPSGKVAVTAFATSAISVFSAHLGFTGSECPELLVPMIAAKLISAFLAVMLALKIEGVKNERTINAK